MKDDQNVKPKKKVIISVPISQADIRAFESSKLLLESKLFNIADAIVPYQNSIKLFNEKIADVVNPAVGVANLYKEHFDSMRKLQKQLLAPSLRITEALRPLVESSKVFESLALSQASIAKQLQGLVISLPLDSYFKTISASANFELTLSRFSTVKSHPSEYLLGGTAIETTRHEQIGIKVSAGFEMRLSTIEAKLDDNNSKLDYLVKRDERRDELMSELIHYVKSTGSPLARIESVTYSSTSTEVLLDDKKIKVRGNTNQSDICQILLGTKESMKKTWEMEDIIEKMGETDSDKNWHRAIYDAVNELNTKILLETKGGISDFFLLTMKTVAVNPKYIG